MDQPHRTAVQAGVSTLYHYEKFNAEYLATVLRDQKIHCSNPANLNDPWDCKPWLDSRALRDGAQFRKTMDAWYRFLPEEPTPDQKLTLEEMLRNKPKYADEFMRGFSRSFQAALARWRIYCLTPDPDSSLMWAHYAHNHQGICLEFSVANPLFSTAREVLYRSEYPTWMPHEFEADRERILEMALTKAKGWAHEREFRLISEKRGKPSDRLLVEGDYFRLPPRALKSVIVGLAADLTEIKKVVSGHSPGLPTKRARRAADHYRLVIE